MVKRLKVKKRKEVLSELTQEIPANGIITVGNDSSATIELHDEKIAPEQFVIVCEEGSMTLLCRVDGTTVNGEALPQGALHNLQFGDEITIDGYTLTAETETNGENPAVEDLAETSAYSSEVQQTLPEAPPPVEIPTAAATEKSERSLSDVLENLRSEEKFYFLIKETSGDNRRVYVETEEMTLGWTSAGECVISTDSEEVEIPRADIRKDWSGVVLYPSKPGSVWLNDETLTAPRRLKNDDKIFLLAKEGARLSLETVIKFHEPTALLILDSILPKELPPPILLDEAANDAGARELDESDLIHSSKIPPSIIKPRRKGNIFGYFTITEIIIMAIGTLITAVIIFLILELY
jgi:pSer/pThr/pTyr-binding forkhead associated (FHA) protein